MSLEETIDQAVRRAVADALAPLRDELRRLQPANDVLDIEQASALTGFSVRTLRARANRKDVPAFKAPGSREWRFRRAELASWLTSTGEALDTEAEARKIAAKLKGAAK